MATVDASCEALVADRSEVERATPLIGTFIGIGIGIAVFTVSTSGGGGSPAPSGLFDDTFDSTFE